MQQDCRIFTGMLKKFESKTHSVYLDLKNENRIKTIKNKENTDLKFI